MRAVSAENVCDERQRKKVAVLETKRGAEVAEIGRFAKALQEIQDRTGYHQVHEREEKGTSGDHGAKAEVEDPSTGGVQTSIFQEVRVFDKQVWEVEK